jgi:hypothetical protein
MVVSIGAAVVALSFDPPNSEVVLKVEQKQYGTSNDNEHENMSYWRSRDFLWAPETEVVRIDEYSVLAMPYFPFSVERLEDVPE